MEDYEIMLTEAEFKEFKPRLKYGWFHLKLYLIFQDLSRFWGDLRSGLNSLNSDSDSSKIKKYMRIKRIWNKGKQERNLVFATNSDLKTLYLNNTML